MRLRLAFLAAGLVHGCSFGDTDTSYGESSDETETADASSPLPGPSDADPIDLSEFVAANPDSFEETCLAVWATLAESCPVAELASGDCATFPEPCQERYAEFLECTLASPECFGADCDREFDAALACAERYVDPTDDEPSTESAATEDSDSDSSDSDSSETANDGTEAGSVAVSDSESESEPDSETDGTSTEPPFAPSGNINIAIRRHAEALCELSDRCLGLVQLLSTGTVEYCTEHQVEVLRISADATETSYQLEAIDTCVQNMSKVTCDDWLSGEVVPGCEFTGQRENAEMCISGGQCQSGWCGSDGTVGYGCGVCTAVPQEGDDCESHGECAAAHACLGGQCLPLPSAGEACDDENPCAYGVSTCVDGICVERTAQLGEPCGPELGLAYCDISGPPYIACDTTTRVCVETPVAEPGDACPTRGFCGGSSTCVEGVCEPSPTVGDACPEGFCRWPGICVDGVCQGPESAPECDAPTEPAPTEPAPTEPAPTEPAPSGTGPTEPGDAGSTSDPDVEPPVDGPVPPATTATTGEGPIEGAISN